PPQNDHSECRMSCRENLNRLEESLTFILARCAERGHQFLVGQLAALIRDPEYRVVERHMVFVHDADAWKNDVVDLLAEVVTEPTELMVVKIDALQDFVARVFSAAEQAFSQPSARPGAPA